MSLSRSKAETLVFPSRSEISRHSSTVQTKASGAFFSFKGSSHNSYNRKERMKEKETKRAEGGGNLPFSCWWLSRERTGAVSRADQIPSMEASMVFSMFA